MQMDVFYLVVCHFGDVSYFVFFFKLKTAYEVRISDWSSDVCSSDLFPIAAPVVGGWNAAKGRSLERTQSEESSIMTYDFWYWGGIPGRGEFVRLALEAGHIPYRECARAADADEDTSIADMARDRIDPPFAPPYLVAAGVTIAQTDRKSISLNSSHQCAPRIPSSALTT